MIYLTMFACLFVVFEAFVHYHALQSWLYNLNSDKTSELKQLVYRQRCHVQSLQQQLAEKPKQLPAPKPEVKIVYKYKYIEKPVKKPTVDATQVSNYANVLMAIGFSKKDAVSKTVSILKNNPEINQKEFLRKATQND